MRRDGYAAIRDYAVIGDGRTVALVARDGSIDWLCLPDLDSPSVFAALLHAGDRGGSFHLAPMGAFTASRRYVPDTNVLETVFVTSQGTVRVTDAMTLPGLGLVPFREIARRIDGLTGRVRLEWRVEPRFGYGARRVEIGRCQGVPIAMAGADAIAVRAWDAGQPTCDRGGIGAAFDARPGTSAMLSLSAAHGEPLVFPGRDEVDRRCRDTLGFWTRWSAARGYDGPWRDAVIRSALVLKLLVYAPSGAIAAAPTTSLPETLGGPRNWDYRFCWIRDSAFTLEALIQLGCMAEARSFFWWFMHATQLTHPRLRVFYQLNGGVHAPERTLPLRGYRDSRPVRIGNGAADQLQLDIYGDLLDTAWLFAKKGGEVDRSTGRELGEVADLVCEIWRQPDRGIWEVRTAGRHFTHSKVMCWVALDRAAALARAGVIPTRNADRWRAEGDTIRRFVEERCWSAGKRAYVQYAGGEGLDASVLMMAIRRYHDPRHARLVSTLDAVRRELGYGPLVYRYTGEDGLPGQEGVFLCCSFWLVEALVLAGRRDEAAALMEELLVLANDVGLYAEELEPRELAFLGNFPQALVHLALISAAVAFHESHAA